MRQAVDVVVGALVQELGPAANGEPTIAGIGTVHDVDGDPGVPLQVSRLDAAVGGVEEEPLAVGVHPDLGRMGRAVRHQRGHHGQVRRSQELGLRRGQGLLGRCSLTHEPYESRSRLGWSIEEASPFERRPRPGCR